MCHRSGHGEKHGEGPSDDYPILNWVRRAVYAIQHVSGELLQRSKYSSPGDLPLGHQRAIDVPACPISLKRRNISLLDDRAGKMLIAQNSRASALIGACRNHVRKRIYVARRKGTCHAQRPPAAMNLAAHFAILAANTKNAMGKPSCSWLKRQRPKAGVPEPSPPTTIKPPPRNATLR